MEDGRVDVMTKYDGTCKYDLYWQRRAEEAATYLGNCTEDAPLQATLRSNQTDLC